MGRLQPKARVSAARRNLKEAGIFIGWLLRNRKGLEWVSKGTMVTIVPLPAGLCITKSTIEI
ncbi:MAG: hypothetical protein PUC61_07730 [Bacteroidales bacterium]|nr:hypothetical protein [Bacteroidales bacterium]